MQITGKLNLNTANEDSSRAAFEKGNSLYEVNYPFIYPSAAEVSADFQKNIAWARYPRSTRIRIMRGTR